MLRWVWFATKVRVRQVARTLSCHGIQVALAASTQGRAYLMPIAMAAGSSRCTLHSLLNKYYCGLQLPRAALLPSSNIHRQIHKSAETSAVLKTSRHALTAIGRTPHASPGTEYALMRGHLPTKLTAPCHWQPTHDCPHLKLYCNIAMSQRRFKSSRPDTNTGSRQDHTNGSDHSHSHSIFHSHSHDEHEHTQSAEGVLKALQGGGTPCWSPSRVQQTHRSSR